MQYQQPLVDFLFDRAELAFQSFAPEQASVLAEQLTDTIRAAMGAGWYYIPSTDYAKRNKAIRSRFAELRKENPSKSISRLAIELSSEIGLAGSTVRDIVSGKAKH